MTFDVTIVLNDPRPVYTCGDRIEGSIIMKSDKPVLVNTLLIQLLCKVTTRTHGTDQSSVSRLHDQESVSFPYCFVKRLVRQPRQFSSNASVDFSFTLPSETKRNEIEPAWQESDIFEHLAEHALPPTWTDDKQMRGSVVHMLEVLMQTSARHESKRFSRVLHFRFSPARAVENPETRCVKFLRAVNAKIPVPPRRKSLITLITPEEKQIVPFQIELLLPTVLYAGGLIPLSVSAYPLNVGHASTYSRNQSQLTPPDSPIAGPIDHTPITFIEGVYAYLAAQTDRRVREDRRPSATIDIPHREHKLCMSEMIPICNVFDRPLAISQTKDRPTSVHAHYPELRLSPKVTPSFRSFSLRRKYELKMKVRVIVNGDQEHLVDLSRPILILPAVYRNTAGALRDNGELMPGLRRRVSEETLPPYEVVDPMVAARMEEGIDEPPPLVW